MTRRARRGRRPGRRRRWLWLVIGLVLGALVWWQGVAVLRVSGGSMTPAYPDGAVVIVVRPALDRLLRQGKYRAGDVVVARVPGGLSLKRIVAVGPATVAIDDGSLTVDGRPVPAPHPTQAGATNLAPTDVAQGQLYLLGDDRRPLASRDSRDFGPVEREAVRGRVIGSF